MNCREGTRKGGERKMLIRSTKERKQRKVMNAYLLKGHGIFCLHPFSFHLLFKFVFRNIFYDFLISSRFLRFCFYVLFFIFSLSSKEKFSLTRSKALRLQIKSYKFISLLRTILLLFFYLQTSVCQSRQGE